MRMRLGLCLMAVVACPSTVACTVDDTIIEDKVCHPVLVGQVEECIAGYKCDCQTTPCTCQKTGLQPAATPGTFPLAEGDEEAGSASLAASLRLLRRQGALGARPVQHR